MPGGQSTTNERRMDPDLPLGLDAVFRCIFSQYRHGIPLPVTPRTAFEISTWTRMARSRPWYLDQEEREALYRLESKVTFLSELQQVAEGSDMSEGAILAKAFSAIAALGEVLREEREEAAAFREKVQKKLTKMEKRIKDLELGIDETDSTFEPASEVDSS